MEQNQTPQDNMQHNYSEPQQENQQQSYPSQQGYQQPQQGYPPQQGYQQPQQGYPPQQNYQQPPYNYPPQQPPLRPTNFPGKGMCTGALVLGICALVLFWVPVFGIILAGVGLVLSILGRKNAKAAGITKGITAGMVLSIIGLVFSFIFTINSLGSADDNDNINNMLTTPTPSVSSDNADTQTNPPNDTSSDVTTPTQEATPTPIQTPSPIEVPEGGVIIFDQNNIVVTVTQINRNRSGYVTGIEFLITNNNTEDKIVSQVPNIWAVTRVNDITFTKSFYETVAAGKSARATMRIDDNEAELFNLKDVYEIAVQVMIHDPSDNFMITNKIEYPTSIAVIAEGDFSTDMNEYKLIYSDDTADVWACGFRPSILLDYALFVVYNKTDTDMRFRLSNLSVNGIMDGGFEESEDIYAGTHRMFEVALDDGVLAGDVQNVEFTLVTEGFLEIIAMSSKQVGLVSVDYE